MRPGDTILNYGIIYEWREQYYADTRISFPSSATAARMCFLSIATMHITCRC